LSSTTPRKPDYWVTPKGLATRIDAIAHNFVWGSFNETLLLSAGSQIAIDQEAYEWLTQGDNDVCDMCDGNEADGPYTQDTVPDFPAHVNCRCQLSVSPEAIGEAS